MTNTKKIISKYMSELAKKSHKKSPRSKEFYRNMRLKRKDLRGVDN